MAPEKLIRMANQIATFFDAQGTEHAPEAIANHLKQFWDPRMRAGLIDAYREGAEGLNPSAAEAVRLLEQPLSVVH